MSPSTPSPTRGSRSRKQHDDVDTNDKLHRHTELLANIDAHLAALVHLTTKERLDSPHLTIAEAAVYLGITPDTLKRKMRRSDIPFHRRPGTAPYFLKHELNGWLSDPETLVVKINRADEQEDPNGKQEAGPLSRETLTRLLKERAEFSDSSES